VWSGALFDRKQDGLGFASLDRPCVDEWKALKRFFFFRTTLGGLGHRRARHKIQIEWTRHHRVIRAQAREKARDDGEGKSLVLREVARVTPPPPPPPPLSLSARSGGNKFELNGFRQIKRLEQERPFYQAQAPNGGRRAAPTALRGDFRKQPRIR